MAGLAEIVSRLTPSQLDIIKRELPTRLQGLTPARRERALREIAGIPELGDLFGKPATAPQAEPEPEQPLWQKAGVSALEQYQRTPWFPAQQKALETIGAGVGKVAGAIEGLPPEAEYWLRPGVTGGAALWAPSYGFEEGRPTPEAKEAVSGALEKYEDKPLTPETWWNAYQDILGLYKKEGALRGGYEEKVPWGARLATEIGIEAPMYIGGAKALGSIPQLARLPKGVRAVAGIEKPRPSAEAIRRFMPTARTLLGKPQKLAPIAKGAVARPDVVDDVTAKLKSWRASFKEKETLRGAEFAKRFEEHGRLVDDWLAKRPTDIDGAMQNATRVLKGKYPEVNWNIPKFAKKQISELRLFGRQRILETAKDYDRITAPIISADQNNFDRAILRTFVGQLDDITGKVVKRAPREFEIKLFERALGSEFTNTLTNLRKSLGAKGFSNFLDAANFPRAVLASFDVSAPLRQGAVVFARYPLKGFQSLKTMFKALVSEKNAQYIDDIIRTRPNTKRGLESGLELTRRAEQQAGRGLKAMAGREESFMSRFAGKIPGIRASERAYVTFLNDMRSRVWEGYVPMLDKMGVGDDTYRAIASLINMATGRGEVGKLRQFMPILNNVFFSPRLVWSRLELPAMLLHKNPVVRKEAWKMFGSFVGMGTGIISGLKLAGFDVGLDPRSAEFGKVKIGNTRLDFWAGFVQFARFFSQVSTAQRKVASGEIKDVKRTDIINNFMQTKFAPMAGFIHDLLEGQTYMGEDVLPSDKVEALKQIRNRLMPLFMQDIYDAVEDAGPEGVLVASPGAFGVGVITYEPPEDIEFQKKIVPIKEQYKEQFGYINSLSDEKSPNYIASSKQRADVREQYYLENPQVYDARSRITALSKGAPDNIVNDYVAYRRLTQVHSGNSINAKIFRALHPEFNNWGQSLEGYEWNPINIPPGFQQIAPVLEAYVNIEDRVWSQFPPQLRILSDQIGALPERQERIALRDYPQILYIRRQIAINKRQMKRQFRWIDDALNYLRSS